MNTALPMPRRRRSTHQTVRLTALPAVASLLLAGLALQSSAAVAAGSTRPDVVELTISDASDLLAAGSTTSLALVKEYEARISAYDDDAGSTPGLRAVIALNPSAEKQAKALDAERAAGNVRGPLHGVPIVVKDNIDLAGMPTTNGAIAFATYKPKNDSTVVRKLQAAGAIVIAKTNLSEFAWSGSESKSGIRGEVRNPYDRSKTSSGSSGGTASAVAASFATAGLGTDTYGSIRNPSANQGLVGVRPTHGLVSLAGVTAQIAPQDTVGPMTKSVEDAAILLDAIAGYDARDPYTKPTIGQVPESYAAGLSATSLQGKKILYLTNARYHGNGATSRPEERLEVNAIQEKALADLEAQGATVEKVELSQPELTSLNGRGWVGMAHWLDEYLAGNDAFWPAGLAAKAAPFDKLTTADYVADGRETEQIKPDAQWLLSTGDLSDAAIEEQNAREASARAAWKQILAAKGADAVVIPTDNLAASPIAEDAAGYSDSSSNASLASGLGAPGIAIPVGVTSAGLPVSLQFTGALYSEGELLSYAYDYEQATHQRVAPSTTPELDHPVVTPVTPTSPATVHTLSASIRKKGTLTVGRSAAVSVTPRAAGRNVAGAKISYRWTVAGAYAGNNRTLKLTKKMVGKRVRVKIVVAGSGYRTGNREVLLGRVRLR